MKILPLLVFMITFGSATAFAQGKLSSVKTKKFKTTSKLKIEGDIGHLIVPENRNNPLSRNIKVKYVHLKSLSANPSAPVIYLEGGGSTSTWQVDSPKDLSDWIEILEVSDMIFIDQRGTDDKSLTYIWRDAYPKEFLVSEEKATAHYQVMIKKALEVFEERKVDVSGYNIVEHAKDVNDLATALGLDKYSIFGFSFGSHIGMTVLKLFPDRVDRTIFSGADAPNQSFNFPSHLDIHVDKISEMVAQDPMLSASIPDFTALVERVMNKLGEKPVSVTVKNPLTKKEMKLDVGPFGLALVLRLDIDDAHDIPAIPRLLYTIDKGNYSMLTWFVQKRMALAMAIPGNGINQGLASGVSEQRWSTIQREAKQSIFGNIVNFPFSAAKNSWPITKLEIDTSVPLTTATPTLFITGTLDCRTSVVQVNETMKGFSQAVHIEVEGAGHEQAMWDKETCNETMPAFLLGKPISDEKAFYAKIEFLPVEGITTGHPSIR